MDNKLFLLVFKNKVLFNLIFSKVKFIHRDILLFENNKYKKEIFKWHELLNNLGLLSYHNYINEIKQHHKYSIEEYNSLEKLLANITRGDSLDVLQHFINEEQIVLNLKNIHTLSVQYNSLKIYNYLESLTNNDDNSFKSTIFSPTHGKFEVRWNYYNALSVVPVSGNIELFIYILDKVDIRGTLLRKKKMEKDLKKYSCIIECVEASAEYGRIEMLDQILSFFGSDKTLEKILINHIPSIFKRTIKNGHLNIIKFCVNQNKLSIQNKLKEKDVDLLSECIKHNQFEMMKNFHENGLGSNKSFRPIDKAIKNGNLEMIKWLHENRTEDCSTDAMDNAALNGHLEIVKWLHFNRSEGCTTYAMDEAAENGHLEIIKWLHENRTEGCTINAMNNAAEYGNLETMKWLHENRTEGCITDAMDFAAENGHLEIIKWFHENQSEGCTTDAMDYAARNGHLEMIKWLHENRTEGCTTDAMDEAARNGHFEIIRWLHENRSEGCTTYAMDFAAENGHLEIIKWLHFNRTEGCTTDAMDFATDNGHIEIMKWLHENRSDDFRID